MRLGRQFISPAADNWGGVGGLMLSKVYLLGYCAVIFI